MDWFIGKARRKDKDTTAAQQEETKQYLHAAMLECTTSERELRHIVNLNEGLDYNEWLASHTIAFFDHINLLYGTISEFCSMSGCPEMSGPCNRVYHWVDEKGKRVKVAAPQYIDYVMTHTQKTVNDESVFPTKFDKEFPVNFESTVKKIMRLLYHVIAHIYHSHFKEIVLLNLHPHLNCTFAHLVLFNERFKLIEEKELEVLHDLAVALKLYPPSSTNVIEAMPAAGASGEGGEDMHTATDDHNNNTKGGDGETGGGEDGVITTQCRSITPFDAYPNGNDVQLIENDDDDASETKENKAHQHYHHLHEAQQFVNSPMLVDEDSDQIKIHHDHHFFLASKGAISPEPMMIEPMACSENIPKKTMQTRSISANAVLLSSSTRSLDLAFAGTGGSALTRRCNSDRSSGKTSVAALYASDAGR